MQLPTKIRNKNYLFSKSCESNFQRNNSIHNSVADTVSNNERKKTIVKDFTLIQLLSTGPYLGPHDAASQAFVERINLWCSILCVVQRNCMNRSLEMRVV